MLLSTEAQRIKKCVFVTRQEFIPLLQISKKDADDFRLGQWIPECELIVEWQKSDQCPVRLRHHVPLIGAKGPRNFFNIAIDPEWEGKFTLIFFERPMSKVFGQGVSSLQTLCPYPKISIPQYYIWT